MVRIVTIGGGLSEAEAATAIAGDGPLGVAARGAFASSFAGIDSRGRVVPAATSRRGGMPSIISLLTGTEDETLAVSQCTVTADTVNTKIGGRAWKLTTAGAVNNAFVSLSPIPPSTSGPRTIRPAQALSAWVYVENPASVTNVQFALTQDASNEVFWIRANTNAPAQPLVTGWNFLRFKLAEGLPAAWTGTSANRFQFYLTTSAATSVTLGHVWLECPDKARMIFVLDRGYKTFVTKGGLDHCRRLGIPITWALDITTLGGAVGTEFEVVTAAQIAEYAAQGDSVSFHGWDGAVTSTMTDAQYRTDTAKSIKWLQAGGYPGRMWRAANVQDTATASAVTAAKGLLLGNAQSSMPSVRLDMWPPRDLHNIARWNFYGRPPAEVENQFSLLKKTHGLMVAYNHGIQDAYQHDATPAEIEHFFGQVETGIDDGWLEPTTFEALWFESGGSFSEVGGTTVATYTDVTGAVVTKTVL